MNLCSDDHVEICYEGRECPLCLANTELQETLNKLEDANEELRDHVCEVKP